MTSLSVRAYTTGIYRQLGLKEEEVTKVQTGGPDGDLGSNEILLSKDKTIASVAYSVISTVKILMIFLCASVSLMDLVPFMTLLD